MYNLNVNINPTSTASAINHLGVTNPELTPRTPEIVNSLIAMTNPFDNLNNINRNKDKTNDSQSSSNNEQSPPSIQHTCSQLIKEGLKLTLQTKRRANSSTTNNYQELKKRNKKDDVISSDGIDDDDSSSCNNNNITNLTPEDEERRRRRRERNKIAATKCRLKKRRKTVILVQESETLETQNNDLKTQIEDLETQRLRLVELLNVHNPNCVKNSIANNQNTSYCHQYNNESVTPLPAYQENFVPIINQSQELVSDYQIKVEGYNSISHEQYFRQNNPYANTNTDAGYTV